MVMPKRRLLGSVVSLLVMTGCSPDAGSTPAANLPAQQMVFIVMSSGGMAPASFLAPSTGRRSIACGELMADPAEVVYQAALENPGARWVIDGATRILAVNSLPLPGDCS